MARRTVTLLAAAALVIGAVLAGCSAPSSTAPARPAPSYYLALGDSLSRGVQPSTAGTSVETAQGYPNQLYARLAGPHPGLRLALLGCPGETTVTMMHGGLCRYQAGSQLAAAEAFLRAHRGHVLLVTIDIGANDVAACNSGAKLGQLSSCLAKVAAAAANLTTILRDLRGAAGAGVTVAGMNYYLPALAQWRDGVFGQLIAQLLERFVDSANRQLDQAYRQAGDPVADVFGTFDSSDFGDPVTVPGFGSVPRNVARVCQWTWECAAAPRGPNQHANAAGYQAIANAFAKVIRLSAR
jgi:lysophospholipase L1-like esterase